MKGVKFEFKEEDIKYIIDNWNNESAHSMKKKFGCSWSAVVKVAESNGLKAPVSPNWTIEEELMLRELSEKYHYKVIAKKMNKTENAIYLKAKKLKITLIQDARKWTAAEEKKLQESWGNVSVEYLAKKLKRSVFSLKVKAVRMDLGPMIYNNLEVMTITDICDLLSVSRDRVVTNWEPLGLKIDTVKLTKNKKYKVVTLEDLTTFLENNQNEWDSRKLEKNMLGLEPEWLVEKRKRDKKENPLWYRRWTEAEKKKQKIYLS